MASISDTLENNDESKDELSGDEDNTTILYTAVQSTPMCMTITTSSKNSSRKRKIRIKDESRNKNRKKSDSSEDIKPIAKATKTDTSICELMNTMKSVYSSRLLQELQLGKKVEISNESLKTAFFPHQLKIINSQLKTTELIDSRVVVAEVSGLFLLFNEYLEDKKQFDVMHSETPLLLKYVVSNRFTVCIDSRKHKSITKFLRFSNVNSNVELTHTFKNNKFRVHLVTKQQIDAEKEILLDTKHCLMCLSIQGFDVEKPFKNFNEKNNVVTKSEFRKLSPIKLTIPKVANFSDDEDIKHEVRSKNDSTKEIINKHIIKKDQAVDQKSFVDIKPAVCLSTPPVKKRPTVRVTEPSKQHRKKRGRSRGWKHKQINIQEVKSCSQNQSVGNVIEGIKELKSENSIMTETNGKNKLDTKNQYFKKYLPQPFRPPTDQEVARFCTTPKPWKKFNYSPGIEPSTGFRISFISKPRQSNSLNFNQNASKNPKKHFLEKAQFDSKLLEVTYDEAKKLKTSKHYGKVKKFILSRYNRCLTNSDNSPLESNTEKHSLSRESNKINDDENLSNYNSNKKKVTLSLAQYRNRKHNVSSPGISPTNDKLSLKDQNFSDEEQNMSLPIKGS